VRPTCHRERHQAATRHCLPGPHTRTRTHAHTHTHTSRDTARPARRLHAFATSGHTPRTVQSCSSGGANVTPSNTRFLRSTRVHIPSGISIDSAVFAQLTSDCPYLLYNGPPLSTLKIFPLCGDLDPIKHMIPWAHQSPHPKRHLDRFSHFCMAHDHDRQTDRPCYSVT